MQWILDRMLPDR